LGVRATREKEVLELSPRIDVNKGPAAVELARTLGALDHDASLLCAGDDRTDEDMFRGVPPTQPRCAPVRVGNNSGPPDTLAEFSVLDPNEMRLLLENILSQRRNE